MQHIVLFFTLACIYSKQLTIEPHAICQRANSKLSYGRFICKNVHMLLLHVLQSKK